MQNKMTEGFYSIARFFIIYGISMAVRGCLEGRGDMLFSGISCTFLIIQKQNRNIDRI